MGLFFLHLLHFARRHKFNGKYNEIQVTTGLLSLMNVQSELICIRQFIEMSYAVSSFRPLAIIAYD